MVMWITVGNFLTSTVYFITNCYGYNINILLLYFFVDLCNTMNINNI
jgi:hypothetical protein